MSAVGNAFKKAAGFLVGNGNKTQSQNSENTSTTGDASPQEQALRDSINSGIASASKDQNQFQDISGLEDQFKSMLTSFVTGSKNPTEDQIKQASDFVDQTFTNQAQSQFNQFQRQYQASQDEQAATMGRSPLDSSIQQQNYRTNADIATNLANQRGSQIAQRSDLLAYQRPMEALNTMGQGMNFINGLNNSAFTNRLNLMNLQSGLANNLMTTRSRSGTGSGSQTQAGPNLGILGNASAIGSGISNFAGGSTSQGLMSMMGGGGSAASIGAAGSAGGGPGIGMLAGMA